MFAKADLSGLGNFSKTVPDKQISLENSLVLFFNLFRVESAVFDKNLVFPVPLSPVII
jgi:hypothetical protein